MTGQTTNLSKGPGAVHLLADVDRLADGLEEHRDRLVALQHALLELINLLDPNGDRVSAQLRQRL